MAVHNPCVRKRGCEKPAKGFSQPLIVDKPSVCQRGLPGRLSSHCSSIQHGRSTPSHRPALTLARCSAPADFASLRVLGAPAASRPPTLASSLVVLPASLGLLRPVSRTARGLRAPPPVSAKILRIFGRGNCKEAIFALENGIFRRKNRPVPAVHAAGDD